MNLLTADQKKADLVNEILDAAHEKGRHVSISRAGRLADKIIAGKFEPDMQRVLDYADPTGEQAVARASRSYKTGPQHHRWRHDDIAYKTAHKRLKAAQGSARSYLCICGKQAHDWAYNHQDPDEMIDPRTGCAYSAHLEHYRPLCRSCHYDLDRRQGKGTE